MKISYHIINIFLVLYFITITKEDICPEEYISVSGLGKCQKIKDILEDKTLLLRTENLFYLATNDEGKIEKNGYKLDIYKLNDTKLNSHKMRKSKLYIPKSCMEKMRIHKDIYLDKNSGIIIIVHDSNNLNDNNIIDTYFIIRHNSENTKNHYINSKTFDFSFCHEDPILLDDEVNIEDLRYSNDSYYTNNSSNTTNITIDIDKILYGRKYGIDLFDPYSDFLNDICFKFKSEKGTDVTLDSRVEDYYQNISFCDDRESSHYISYNYSDTKKSITFRCAFGYYTSIENQNSYLDIIDSELKSLVSVSNIKVITCYKKFLNIRDIIRNYGGMICIFVLIIQIVCFLIFCFCGIKPIEEKLDDLFQLGKAIVRRLSMIPGFHIDGNHRPRNSQSNANLKPRKKFNLWGQFRKFIKRNKLMLKQNKKLENTKKKSNPPKKIVSNFADKRSDRDMKGSEEIKIIDINEDIFNNNKKNKKSEKSEISLRKKTDGELSSNSSNNTDIPKNVDSLKVEENMKELDKKSENSQLYNYEADELNELPFDKAIKHDKRTFCEYYGNILLFSHIILNVFFRHNDYNLFVVKLGLLFMTFPINLTMNIFFFTNKTIKVNYVKSLDDISLFWSNIANTVYSSILANALLIMLKLICLTHNSVKTLRKIRNVKEAKKKSACVLRCIRFRVSIYFILSFAFLIIFGFYVLCFCAVFENTQINLVKSTLTSWLMSLLYPFIICFFTSLIRNFAFQWKSSCMYKVKQILQFL